MRSSAIKYAFVVISVAGIFLPLLHAEDVPTNYITYSLEELKIGDRAGTTGEGLVGSKATVVVGSDANVYGSILANGNVTLYDRSTVYGDLTTGRILIQSPPGSATVTGTIQQHASVTTYTIPTRSVTIGTQDIRVNNDDSLTISAGNYDTIQVLDRGKLRLNDGVYNAKAFILGNDVRLVLNFSTGGGIEVNASQTLTIGDRIIMSFSSQNNPTAVNFYSNGTSEVAVGYDGIAYGTFSAPNAKVVIHDRTAFTGAVYGKRVELQPSIFFAADTVFPTMHLCTPAPGSVINDNTPRITIWYDDDESGIDTRTFQVSINGTDYTSQFQPGSDTAWWQVPAGMALPQGTITVASYIEDRAGNAIENTASFTVDTTPPVVAITSPSNGTIINQNPITISWTVDGVAQATQLTENIVEGVNRVIRSATDAAGNTGADTITVTLDTQAPVVVITSPADGSLTNQSPITVLWTVDGVEQTTETSQSLTEGDNVITRSFTDEAGNVGTATIHVTLQTQGGQLPPDPATVAPQLSTTAFTDMKSATAFLYTGENPIQTGVDSTTIETKRVAVIRGKVLSRDGNLLSGVVISVQGYPEFGQTLSRTDGAFDIAVNGGDVLTLVYEKDSYFTVQRKINVPWQDYTAAPDVIMLQPDNNVTAVSVVGNSQMQVARGALSNDNSGSRQATILFPAGIQVTNLNAETINVRATEYTVGENGPKSMPAELPSGVGYTYCVELSVDGVDDIQFSAPVYLYLENFLHFPTGGIVPAAYYDQTLSSCNSNTGSGWIPSQNGRIISILSIQDNKAVIDIDGNGSAADSTEMAGLGITEEEVVTLASTYSVGQSLWRVPLTHFSSWDLNWGIVPPADAEPPEQPDAEDDAIDEVLNPT